MKQNQRMHPGSTVRRALLVVLALALLVLAGAGAGLGRDRQSDHELQRLVGDPAERR